MMSRRTFILGERFFVLKYLEGSEGTLKIQERKQHFAILLLTDFETTATWLHVFVSVNDRISGRCSYDSSGTRQSCQYPHSPFQD